MTDRYCADPASLRRIVPLDGLAAIFHRRSGITHILASPAPEILDALEAGPADVREIVRRLTAAHDIAGDDPVAIVAARLDELAAAGLVWRA